MSVDLALVLAVDCSSSVDAGDFKLQMLGIAEAMRNPLFFEGVQAGDDQRIALSLVQWSTRNSQHIVIKWRLLSAQAEILQTATEIASSERIWQLGGTGMAAAINFCNGLMQRLPTEAKRKVIDVSGDGEDNENGDVETARRLALSQGITINGLPIIDGSQYIESYYRHQVIGGPGSFLVPAANMLAFKDAMTQKLFREISPKLA